jgi:hypothetical protein
MVKLSYANQKNSTKVDELGRPVPERIEIVFSFDDPYFGFGEIRLVQDKDQVFVDAEHMSLDRVTRYLCNFLESAITETDEDSVRHRKYNNVMLRSCCSDCEVCYPGNNK